MNKIIAVDFDGTLFITDWPTIIEPKRKTEPSLFCGHVDAANT